MIGVALGAAAVSEVPGDPGHGKQGGAHDRQRPTTTAPTAAERCEHSEHEQSCHEDAEYGHAPGPHGYQPRSRHSARWGRSAPSVESLPWPG